MEDLGKKGWKLPFNLPTCATSSCARGAQIQPSCLRLPSSVESCTVQIFFLFIIYHYYYFLINNDDLQTLELKHSLYVYVFPKHRVQRNYEIISFKINRLLD